MTDVWLVWDERERMECVLKVSRVSCDAEVAVMHAMQSIHTPRVLRHGRLPDGTSYIAMEYLRGLDLESMVERYGRIGIPRALYLMRQACRGLADAHRAGVIHRDVKAGNLHCSQRSGEEDRLRILDFGVAFRAGDPPPPLDQVTGTPAFMAPEAFTGEELSPASDVYALGCTCYYAITGEPPFSEGTDEQLAAAHRFSAVAPPSLRSASAHVPRGFERAILRALAKDPDKRFRDAAAMADALDEAADDAAPWDRHDAEAWWQLVHEGRLAVPKPRGDRTTTVGVVTR